MRAVLFFLLFTCSSAVFGSTAIDKKIHKTSSALQSYTKNYSVLNAKMAQTAKAIIKQKTELAKKTLYLKKLEKELSLKESSHSENIQQLKILKKSQEALQKKRQKLEEDLIFVIAKTVSLSVVLEKEYPENEEAIMEFEVLKAMLKASKDKAKLLSRKFFENEKNIDLISLHVSSLEVAIANIDQKRKEVIRRKKENKKALKKLTLAKESYKKELKSLIRRQNALKRTLSKLNLIKIDEIKRAKEEKMRKLAFAKRQKKLGKNLPKVKKHGSSYQAIKTIRYRGRKTIAPLNAYTITKKYGTYTDPIYGIKIFNESISLKPKYPNAKVKTVFNGKVIYAAKTAVLDNIVIVEHKNGLHTIYANLSQIAPNVKKGKKIAKGATIGRVKDELVFEVTQKTNHINPIRLFQ
ncbi:peptidoglycan DD-metalloendopeptidase family protein [Sulfurimonas sp. SWIR-19]|uniref:murein hydrolase activator EnvC family protein n=1 Tax=Sulfurimonas sp. SWIR-19 TaxID=2878390 RepID=UPI001CF12A4C|nr:peptidoglycan DD-metalloendopeptidase family protein [Sulfurimonas sp. SWIR-19]UCM99577.1 peptidoglycan DD-metalloendopeptidase family protein [Sulfurimonas sp. SWIR-19]